MKLKILILSLFLAGCGGGTEPLDHTVTIIPVNCAASDACAK